MPWRRGIAEAGKGFRQPLRFAKAVAKVKAVQDETSHQMNVGRRLHEERPRILVLCAAREDGRVHKAV